MNNIKTYKDGARMILVVENCTGELAAKVNDFILDILGFESAPATVPEIVPEKVQVEEKPDLTNATPITRESGKAFDEPAPETVAREYPVPGISATFGKALDTGDTNAVVTALMETAKMDPSMRYTIARMSKKYIYEDCSRRIPDAATTVQIKRFFAEYAPLIKKSIKFVLDSMAVANLDDFFALTDEYVQQDAYRVVLEDLIARSRTN